MISLEKLKSMVLGHAVGDACGVPVEFVSRATLKSNPVKGMLGYGTHNQPAGTWSDDTSLAVAAMDSIARLKKIDYEDIMKNFLQWFTSGKFTATGESFDCGNTTAGAIENFTLKTPPLSCGLSGENSNGNGSLMRIFPAVLYACNLYGEINEDALKIVHNVSALTHAHPRSLIACGIYAMITAEILKGLDLRAAIFSGLDNAQKFYSKSQDLEIYSRLFDKNFGALPENKISSRGYVVYTLEAAIWCLLNTDDYKSLVLKAVNLGRDTDTTAAIAGGIAGLFYGVEQIPNEWLDVLQNKSYLEEITVKFFSALN